MTGISHKLAQRYLRAAADGLIRDNQRVILDAHLRECDSCRAEADELKALEARLQKNFQARWDASDGPSRNVMTTIQSRSRRIIMTNRINTGLKTAAGLAALLVLIVFLNSAVGKLRNSSVLAGATESIGTAQSTQPSGLIAFVSIQDGGSYEIFTMKADGSEVTNLTNNPATDESLAWSPDGTRIAFESDRSGDTDIYVMNADGSNVSRLTDDRGFEGYFSWSPDGQRIVYISAENSLNYVGRVIVMNADGSNKIVLTKETGSYGVLGWSPDGQKIVYKKQQFDPNKIVQDAGIYISDFDGVNQHEWLRSGVFYQIYWETPEQFLITGWDDKDKWNIERYQANGNLSSNQTDSVLVHSSAPIVAVFEKTYVVEDQSTLMWYSFEGDPIPLSPWSFTEICEIPEDLYLHTHFISPDKKHSFVNVPCRDGTTSFFLMNEDGTKIHQLGKPITNTNFIPFDISWSPDGKYVTMPIADRQNQDIYFFDIEKMKNDPSVQPIQLTTDGATKYGATWQPQPKEEPVVIKATEEKPTPTPLTFSLTVQEAEALAGFDVLEPTYLPEAYTFQGAGYDPQTQKVTLTYASPLVDPIGQGRINIYQQRGDVPQQTDNLPPQTTQVPVGDVMGEFTRGVWIYESGAPTPRWDGSADYYALNWQKDGISFMVDFIGGEGIPNINLEGLRAIAESMKNVPTAQQIPPIGTDKSNGEWIAFIGGRTIPDNVYPTALTMTQDIYITHPNVWTFDKICIKSGTAYNQCL